MELIVNNTRKLPALKFWAMDCQIKDTKVIKPLYCFSTYDKFNGLLNELAGSFYDAENVGTLEKLARDLDELKEDFPLQMNDLPKGYKACAQVLFNVYQEMGNPNTFLVTYGRELKGDELRQLRNLREQYVPNSAEFEKYLTKSTKSL